MFCRQVQCGKIPPSAFLEKKKKKKEIWNNLLLSILNNESHKLPLRMSGLWISSQMREQTSHRSITHRTKWMHIDSCSIKEMETFNFLSPGYCWGRVKVLKKVHLLIVLRNRCAWRRESEESSEFEEKWVIGSLGEIKYYVYYIMLYYVFAKNCQHYRFCQWAFW